MERRQFLFSAAVAAGLARTPVTARAMRLAAQAKTDRIAIMTLNFQQILLVPDTAPGPNRTLELFDVGQMIADTYGVHRVEFQHYHLASTETSYLRELRARLGRAKSRATQINLEFSELNMSAPTLRNRLLAIDLTKAFVDHAVVLGAERVMVNQGGPGVNPTPENKVYSIPTLKTMVDYGRSKGIMVSVETRGAAGAARGAAAGPAGVAAAAPAAGQTPAPVVALAPGAAPVPAVSGREAWTLLAEIIKAAGSYSNVDVGGARAISQQELHDCLRTMFPFTAGTMHTRLGTSWDLATAMRYLEKDLGFRGLYTIETNGGHMGTKAIYDVVVANL
jgi:hypothetical protein